MWLGNFFIKKLSFHIFLIKSKMSILKEKSFEMIIETNLISIIIYY